MSTLYEGCRENVTSFCVDNGGNINSSMYAVHGQLLHFLDCVDAVARGLNFTL